MSARPVAAVTGARRGIGLAIARALAGAGFDIAVLDREKEAAEALAAVGREGARTVYVQVDIAAVESHAAAVAKVVDAFGRVDCLVNNAGIGAVARGDFLDLAPENFDHVMAVNLRGTVFFTQAMLHPMLASDRAFPRSVVNITSVSAAMSSPDRLDYCLSKAALAAFGQGLALRLAPESIAVFEVRPGIIRTDMTAGVAEKYDSLIAGGLVPAGRWGEAGDIGAAVAALAAGGFGFATGSVIHADGGLSIARL